MSERAERPDAEPTSEPTRAALPKSDEPRVDEGGGAVVPGRSADDTDTGWGELAPDDAHDSWLREQRPPHWD